AEGLPLGVVTAINGATRFDISVSGVAGHAGTVPMTLRRDALAAAAEMMLAIEARARAEAELVATVGRVEAEPGAVNVIPGRVRFSLDIRAPRDEQRQRAVADVAAMLEAIAARRGVSLQLVTTHEAGAYICDPQIVAGLEAAVEAVGAKPRLLPSGAGHDTMIMGRLCPAGMLFVRCKGGVSHNPLESITLEDCEIALAALTRFVRDFRA
ncbi:MAG: hydantoinase/carbamoylase family amidase, partial [Hyphomicrobiales bacterium]|nr:hydantoinase/carbamoylase family amidase [Hyphomicrobiales bacterium]